ncbi:MAG TPA: NADP-dependent oxidoreductase [Kofleriaceae bacterium]
MSIRTLRFHRYGEPADVLQLDHVEPPEPAADRIRVVVHACGLNPADWALCRGLFAKALPRGIGLDVAGVVDAIGAGVTDVAVGDRVMGAADFANAPIAGAGDAAILNHWARVPASLDLVKAAALPMAIETAYRSIENLGVAANHTLVVSGAGTVIGFAAVQMARLRGARVIATAGDTYAEQLRGFGADVTPYGAGLADRVRALAGGDVDLVLDTAPPSGAIPELVKAAGGDPKRVLTISDLAGSKAAGARHSFGESPKLYHSAYAQFVELAAAGTFSVPIAQTYPLDDWRAAMTASLTGRARGKLVLVP